MTPLTFYREYVSKNKPVIIEGAISHWPALTKWQSDEYLAQVAGEEKVTIDFTPDGRGDSIVDDRLFVTPVEEEMRFKDFLPLLDHAPDASPNEAHGYIETGRNPPGVPYCQHQNSSFTEQFKALHSDAGLDIPLATEALGAKPHSANFWMGSGHSISTMHQDHDENLYAVICGEKIFTLVPPAEEYWLTRRSCPRARWVRSPQPPEGTVEEGVVDRTACDNSDCVFVLDDEEANAADEANADVVNRPFIRALPTPAENAAHMVRKGPFVTELVPGAPAVPWIDMDVDAHPMQYTPGTRRAQLARALAHINKFTVSVKAGQVLYLPAMWFHTVQQRGRTIAVNFWYDMQYDVRFLQLEFMRRVGAAKNEAFQRELAATQEEYTVSEEVRNGDTD